MLKISEYMIPSHFHSFYNDIISNFNKGGYIHRMIDKLSFTPWYYKILEFLKLLKKTLKLIF